jgi:hypothetical protein
MVEVLGRATAVLTAVAVAGEHGPARQRYPRSERDPDELDEADHRRCRDRGALGAERGAVVLDDLGLVLEHEDHGPAGRDDAEGLEGGIEQERSPQAAPPPIRA